jgi:hypothetical protein
MMAKKRLKVSNNPLADIQDLSDAELHRDSKDLIYESIMRGGGEPFGAPFEFGTQSLTQRIVEFLKQRGFFSFETLEKIKPRNRQNKYTRYGATTFRGRYRVPAKKPKP